MCISKTASPWKLSSKRVCVRISWWLNQGKGSPDASFSSEHNVLVHRTIYPRACLSFLRLFLRRHTKCWGSVWHFTLSTLHLATLTTLSYPHFLLELPSQLCFLKRLTRDLEQSLTLSGGNSRKTGDKLLKGSKLLAKSSEIHHPRLHTSIQPKRKLGCETSRLDNFTQALGLAAWGHWNIFMQIDCLILLFSRKWTEQYCPRKELFQFSCSIGC